MHVSTKHNAVILRSRNPSLITTLVPGAKKFVHRGCEFVAVPHHMDAVRLLRNVGIKVPSPIATRYDWPRSFSIQQPFKAQLDTAAFLTLHRRAYVLNGLGSGKTLAALWAYDYLRRQGLAGKLLVVAPLSTLELAWADTIFEHFPHLDFLVLHSSRDRRIKMLSQDAHIYITNHDGLKILEKPLASRMDITHVVVDEVSQCARNAKTDRWKSLNTVINKHMQRACWGMTATPIPTAPTDAWAQARLITPETVPHYFTRFRDMVMQQRGPYQWLPRANAIDTVYSVLQPAIRFSREECVDLPPTTYTERFVALTADQAKHYKAMETTLRAEIDTGSVTAVNEAVKASKLVQIACGLLYANNGPYIIDSTPRINETLQIIQDSQSKVIVFAPFVAVVKHLADVLRGAGLDIGVIYGEVSKTQRDAIFHGFERGSSPQVIVAQPAAMSHGLTLVAASTIIWYAPVDSAEIYEQANGRITRPGQKHNTLIANISGSPIEKKMYARLKRRQSMQNILLDMTVAGRDTQ